MNSLFAALEFNRKNINTYILLLCAPVLLTIYRYHGYSEYFGAYFPNMLKHPLYDFYSHLWQFFIFFALTLIVPMLIIKFQFKRPQTDFGFGFGDLKYGLKFVLITLPLIIAPLIFAASKMVDVRAEYPLAKLLFSRHDLIFWYEAAYVILYYIAWEFFFRGFLLFGLKEQFGNLNAVLIQTISSCLIHIGKPEGEIIGSIIVGIIFGAVALRTRSIWYVFILHASIGLLTDIFIIFL